MLSKLTLSPNCPSPNFSHNCLSPNCPSPNNPSSNCPGPNCPSPNCPGFKIYSIEDYMNAVYIVGLTITTKCKPKVKNSDSAIYI